MKEKIHPKYYEDARVVCACGNIFTTGSTRKELRVEICSKCHPYYTGEKRMMDTAGRVERFRKRYALSEKAAEDKKAREVVKLAKAPPAEAAAPAPAEEKKPRKVKKAKAAPAEGTAPKEGTAPAEA